MKNIGRYWDEFYRDDSETKNLVIYEQEKRYFPMQDFDRFLESVPTEIPILDTLSSSFLRDVPERITLYWGYILDGEEKSGGEFNLYHLLNALISNTADDGISNAYVDPSALRWIDAHPHTGDGVRVLCDSQKWPDWQHIQLMISDENGKLYDLTINYESYVRWTYITKGFYNWQYLFVKKKSMEADMKKYLLTNYFLPMKMVLPTLFPNMDYSDFFKAIDQF